MREAETRCLDCTSWHMEFSPFVTGIRPPSVPVLVYETLILTNQGVPYLYVIRDRILPAVAKRIHAHRMRNLDRV